MSHEIFFLDTETTSADTTKAHVVQFAMVTKFLTKDEWGNAEFLIKPPCPIDIWAMATHHITPKMVQNSPGFKESEGYEVLKRRLDLGHILVAHNAPYDVAVLANDGVVVEKYIDTLKVAKHVLEDSSIESFSLQYLRYFYTLDESHEWELTSWFAHSALYDTVVLKWFYEFLEAKVRKLHPGKDPVERMLELTNTPLMIRTFRFWKHNGKTIEEVSRTSPDYLEWLLGSEMQKPEHEQNVDMIYTLRHWLKK